MKRTLVAVPSLVFLLSLSVISCDAMFNNNLFAKMTHPTPSVTDIQSKTPAQLLQYVSSAANVTILTDNPDLKAAALSSLSATYSSPTAAPANQQTAAVAAADISIQTVPEASNFSASVLAALAIKNTSLSVNTTADVTSLIKTVLPSDIGKRRLPAAASMARSRMMG